LKPRLVPLLRVRRESRLSASKGTTSHPLRMILERPRRRLPLSPRCTQPSPGPHPHHPLHLPHDFNYLPSRAPTAELVLLLVGRRQPARSLDFFWTTSIPLPQRPPTTRYNGALGSLVSFCGAARVGEKDHHHLEAVARGSMPHRLPSPPPCLRPSLLAPLAAGARLYWLLPLWAPLPAGTPSCLRAVGPAPLSTGHRPSWLSSQVSILSLARIAGCACFRRRTSPATPVVPGDASCPRRRQSSPTLLIGSSSPTCRPSPSAQPCHARTLSCAPFRFVW